MSKYNKKLTTGHYKNFKHTQSHPDVNLNYEVGWDKALKNAEALHKELLIGCYGEELVNEYLAKGSNIMDIELLQ